MASLAPAPENPYAAIDDVEALREIADDLSDQLDAEAITEAEEESILLRLENILMRYIELKPDDIIGAYFDLTETLIKLNKYDQAIVHVNTLLQKIKSHNDLTEQSLFQSYAFLLRAEIFEGRIGHETVSGDKTRALTAINTCLDLLESITDTNEEKVNLRKKALILRAGIYSLLEQNQESWADIQCVQPLLSPDDPLRVRVGAMRNLVLSKLFPPPPEGSVNSMPSQSRPTFLEPGPQTQRGTVFSSPTHGPAGSPAPRLQQSQSRAPGQPLLPGPYAANAIGGASTGAAAVVDPLGSPQAGTAPTQ